MTAALILSIFKALPSLWKAYQESIELYYKQMRASDQTYTNDVEKDRSALVAALKQPGLNHEEISRIRRLLYGLHKL